MRFQKSQLLNVRSSLVWRVSIPQNHYDYAADRYDAIYEKHQEVDDQIIADILKKNKVNSVLDLSCGTGQQVVYLSKKGFKVSGIDINQKMLSVAKKKIKSLKLKCVLSLGDMRTTKSDKCDAAITIFNAIGHLTKADFIKALKNISKNH